MYKDVYNEYLRFSYKLIGRIFVYIVYIFICIYICIYYSWVYILKQKDLNFFMSEWFNSFK